MTKQFTTLTGQNLLTFNPSIHKTMTILKKLEEKRIVFFEISPSGELFIGECCDYYYKTSLTKTEVSQLINELESLNKQIKTQTP